MTWHFAEVTIGSALVSVNSTGQSFTSLSTIEVDETGVGELKTTWRHPDSSQNGVCGV